MGVISETKVKMLGLSFNIFRYLGDFSHLFSFVVLFYRLWKAKSCAGISVKTQELYLIVFVTRYLDLFENYSTYNTVFKVMYIVMSLAIVLLMRLKEPYKSSYINETQKHDTFQRWIIFLPCIALAVMVHYDNSVKELLWTFSIYLEAVAILPQIFVLHYTKKIENLTSHYMFFLGSYRALYILNWIYRYMTEMYYRQWLVWISGAIQTVLYVDFFFHYIKAKREGFNKDVTLQVVP